MEIQKFLIVDDVLSFRLILRQILQKHEGWVVVGDAHNGMEAVERVLELTPDVVLMDVAMPLRNGIEATRQIKQIMPQTRIILFSGHFDEEFRCEGMRAGADAFLYKEDIDTGTLKDVLRDHGNKK